VFAADPVPLPDGKSGLEQMAQLSALDAIMDERPPQYLQTAGYLVAAMVAFAVLAAAFVQADVVVQGSGQLTTDVPPVVLQPMERSIVREMRVKVGDTVKKGQVLAMLDSTFIQADVASLAAQHETLLAQVRRIESEWLGTRYEPATLSEPVDILQAAINKQRLDQYASRLKAFDEEILRTETMRRTLENDRKSLVKQLAIAKDVEKMRTQLYENQTGSKLQYLEAQSFRLRADRDHETAVNRLAELEHTLATRMAERQAFVDEWKRNLLEELDRTRTELAKLNEVMAKAQRMRDLVVLSAPADGVVLDMARRTAGSVVREAEPLMTIVADNAVMIAEVMIKSGDIGYAKVGDEVIVKIDALPYQRHGSLKGKLKSISEESYVAQQSSDGTGAVQPAAGRGGASHRARIELSATKLGNMPVGVRLIPGMTVNAEIKIGTRSVLAFFFQPILRGFDESIREP